MPWKASTVMEERLRFVGRLLDGESMSDVCWEFGISRKTGYKIYSRYREHGLFALTDRSRRPVRYANQLPQQVESLIVTLRNRRYRLSITSTQVLPGRRTGTRDATALAERLPRYVTSKAGFEPAFPMVRSIRNLHQRSLSRQMRQSKIAKLVLSRRSQRRAAIANPSWFALRSVSGSRLVPSSRPRASDA
jgi:Helix-turn-helix domain